METRRPGRTDLEISILGLGGFHLLEIELETVRAIVVEYLKAGGNYFETAHSYGNGISEKKLGEVLPKNLNIVVATKTGARDRETARTELLESLKNLDRDHVDILFLHGVTTEEDWVKITAAGGAMETAEWAKREGLARYIGITSHGHGGALLTALHEYGFDVLMTQLNYYDRFNFPEIETKVLPFAISEKIGILAMKPLADGYLWQNPELAFGYLRTLPVDCIVSGINSMDQLQNDMYYLSRPILSSDELENIFSTAPELGNYVCRQCLKCLPCPLGIEIPRFFLAEGRYDRQRLRGEFDNAADYALKDRLAHWFRNEEYARKEYAALFPGIDICNGCGICTDRCPYGIDIPRKLRIVKAKLERNFIW